MKWLFSFCLALLLGVSAQAQEVKPTFYIVQAGDTLSSRFGPKTGLQVCQLNKLANCNTISIGQALRLPSNVGGNPAMLNYTQSAVPFRWTKVGGAPLAGCGKRDEKTINEEAWVKLGLTEEEKSELREKIAFQTFDNTQFVPGMHLLAVAFCEQGKVTFRKNVVTAWHKDLAVWARTYVLASGRKLHWVRNCGNWVPDMPVVPVAPSAPSTPPGEASKEPTPAPVIVPPSPTPAEPQVPPEEEELKQVVSDYDWDLGFHVGGDKAVTYGGFEGAYYPILRYKEWGRHAIGVGAFGSLWSGSTPDGYGYSGETLAVGLANKFSFKDRRDLGIKFPMIGGLWERGHDASGDYQQKRRTSLWCASASYTDASREKEGKTSVPEWQLWASLCGPLSQTKAHSWQGQALDTSSLQDTKYILGLGGRVFLSKNLGADGVAAKLQPFVEVGINRTSPNPTSSHLYVGLRTVNKVWGLGVGPHHGDLGTVLGATLTYDAGLDYKLHIQAERWTTMIQSLEALGVATD